MIEISLLKFTFCISYPADPPDQQRREFFNEIHFKIDFRLKTYKPGSEMDQS